MNRAGWFVGAKDDAVTGHSKIHRPHRRRADAVVEQAPAGAEHQRERHQPETVDKLMLQQRLEQGAASPDLQLIAGLVLQRLHAVAAGSVWSGQKLRKM